VVTQFHGSGSKLDSISQYFIQNGKKIEVPGSKHVAGGEKITPEFCDAAKDKFGDNRKFQEMGGLPQMGDATGKGMVLVMSVWDDVSCLSLTKF
jgi:cellulose 1,4-beta-cellobiosidase